MAHITTLFLQRGVYSRCQRILNHYQSRLFDLKVKSLRIQTLLTTSIPRNSNNKLGLFGLQDLTHPKDWAKVTDRAIERVSDIRRKIDEVVEAPYSTSHLGGNESNSKLTNGDINLFEIKKAGRLLFLLDQISNEVCSVIDAAELCRNVHATADFVAAAEACVMTLSSFIHSLNADTRLYEIVSSIANNQSLLDSLGEEASYLARDLQREFESDGVHLLDREKKMLADLHASLVETETLYRQTASKSENPNDHQFVIGPFVSHASYSLIKQWLSNFIPQPSAGTLPPSSLVCSGSPKIGEALLSSIEYDNIRAKIWRETLIVPSSNAATLGKLIQDRHHLAESLGYPTYAHKFLKNKVCSSPEKVWTFLSETSEAVRPFARKEWDELLSLKRRIFSNQNTSLEPWDIPYLIQRASQERLVASSGGRDSGRNAINELSKYLTVDACIESLKIISHELLGLNLHKEPLGNQESWLAGDADRNGILKFRVSDDSTGRTMGTVYLDLFQRNGKFPGAAHFVIRCGCKTASREYVDDSITNSKDNVSDDENEEEYQNPVVALIFNFSPSSRGSGIPGKGWNLTLHELETLYHEWGHACHSLLSRTTFQHLSGTRGAVDFVEVPSNLFEYWAQSPRVMKEWMGKSSYSRPSEGLIDEALSLRSNFSAIRTQQQILYAAADQFIFGPRMGNIKGMTPLQIYNRALEGTVECQKLFTGIPLPSSHPSSSSTDSFPSSIFSPFNATSDAVSTALRNGQLLPNLNLHRHCHFIDYGGGYYSYLFAKMHAAQIWKTRFESNPFSREAGKILRQTLRWGAARDPQKLLTELSGSSLPKPEYLLDA